MLATNHFDGASGEGFRANLVEHHPLPTWVIDPKEFRTVYANAAARLLFKGKESISLTELFPEPFRVSFFHKINSGLKFFSGVSPMRQLNSPDHIVEIFAAEVLFEGKSFYQLTVVDISDRVSVALALEAEKQRYKTYIDQSSEGIYCQEMTAPIPVDAPEEIIIKLSGKFSYLSECNNAFAHMYGYESAGMMTGMATEKLIDFNESANIEFFRQFIKNGFKTVDAESHEKDRYGASKYFLNNAIGIIEDGLLKRIWGTQRDITVSKNKDKQLRILAQLVEQTSDVLTASDLEFRPLTWNRAAETIFGIGAEKVLGNHLRQFIELNYKDATREDVRTAISRDGKWRGEAWFERPSDKKIITILVGLKLVKDSIGEPVSHLITATDITERKEYELKLKESEMRFRDQAIILENVSDIIITTDLEYRVKVWNKIAEAYYGISEEEAKGVRIGKLIPFTFYGTTASEALQELQEQGSWAGEVSFVNKDGNRIYFHHKVKYVYDENNNRIGYLASARDITDRKIADEKLKQSEQFYRTLIADSLDGMLLTDPSGIITFCSPSVKNVLGYEFIDVIGRNAFEFVHPDDVNYALDSFQREVVENPVVKYIVIRLKKNTGEWLWCMVRGHNLLHNPNINSIVIYFHDDTKRKQASEALKESEKRFRTLIRDMHTGVLLQDGEGNIIMSNNVMTKLFDVTEEELINNRIWEKYTDVIHENGKAFVKEDRPSYKALKTRKMINDVVMGVFHPGTKERIWIIVTADPILDENGSVRHVVCSFNDITERKKMEAEILAKQINHQKQLTQASIDGQENERREIGKELHDNIGQQLTTIKLFLDLAKSTADESTEELVTLALKGVGDVINDIRAMSRSLVPSTLKDLGLIESVRDLIDSIERTQMFGIHFDHSRFREDLLPENQKLTLFRIIQEQLNNVVKHAEAKNVWIQLTRRSNRILLKVRDDGKGFDHKTIRKGLGFINMKNRAELFEGRAEIRSVPGEGCLLEVWMPVVLQVVG